MSRSSDEGQVEPSGKGQVEPTAALAAVFAVCVGVSLYAGVLHGALPGPGERAVATQAVDRVHEQASTAGVVRPGKLDRAPAAAPAGHRLNATLTVGERRWRVGPAPPAAADGATRRVSVHLGPASVRPGRLGVVLWKRQGEDR